MTTSVDDPPPGRRAAARASAATPRRASDDGRFRYHVCSLEPGGEYEETIVEVAGDDGPRFFATDTGARMTEVSERYVVVRRTSEIRSMHELGADEMAELEAELGFVRPVAGRDPLEDPAWTEFLDEAVPSRPTGPVTPITPSAPQPEPLSEADAEPEADERIPIDEFAELAAAPDPIDTDPSDTDPARSTRDEHMTMDSDADWTFEQFEAVVAGSAPAPAPAPARPVPVAPVTPIAAASAVRPGAPVPGAPAPVAPAHAPVAPASAPSSAPAANAAALQIGLAQGIAFVAHRGQTDKLGAEYIDHPARVAETFDPVAQPVEVAVAWLHDVLEDTDLTAERLREAGVEHEIIDAVQLLTRTADVSAAEYYARIRTNAVARNVKLADIADNSAPWRLRKLDHDTQARLAEKYAKARAALA
ncbi:hypothetical protein [Agromyces aureus]|uniref:hypothetical protein n=1 Tax=Agromyces aureus TaxID=453304 RepID=UPI000A737EC5|nr:hypothetical protein [Agromyces aureus]